MSHQATNWAIKQRGIKPATKIVLWHLCDRYHPDHGCFPSQETLAYDCEMSRASINRCIDELVAAGLVQRHRRTNPDTKKRLSTEYTFAFQKTMSQNETRDSEAMSQNDEKPCLKNGDSHVSNCDTNPVREPVIEPVTRDARESDLFSANEEPVPEADSPDLIDEGFKEFWSEIWPSHKRKTAKVDCEKVYRSACTGKHKKADQIDPAELNRCARAYIASVRDLEFLKAPLAWLRQPGWEPFMRDGPTYRLEDLNIHAKNLLMDGICPPSMKDENGQPNAAAQHWLQKFRGRAA